MSEVNAIFRGLHQALLAAADAMLQAEKGLLLSDRFMDTDGAYLTAHVMNFGPGWEVSEGDFDIREKSAMSGMASECVAAANAGTADVAVEVVVNQPANAHAGVVARLSDEDNYWCAVIDIFAQEFKLFEKVGGTFTLRDSEAFVCETGRDYLVSISASGTTITAVVTGGPELSYSSATHNQSATRHGIRCEGSTDVKFNNFSAVAF